MKTFLRPIFSAALGLLLLSATLTARGTVTGSSVANLDGSYTYSYVVDNTAGAFDISFWSLEFDFLAPDWNQADILSGGDVSLPNPRVRVRQVSNVDRVARVRICRAPRPYVFGSLLPQRSF